MKISSQYKKSELPRLLSQNNPRKWQNIENFKCSLNWANECQNSLQL